jgi:APA family basic amino acid/polyamine antiporter
LRYTDPDRARPFRVPFVHVVGVVGASLCVYLMLNLPSLAWIRFMWWLLIGLAFYFVYGFRHSRLRKAA